VSKAGTKHLYVIAFEAEETRTCVLSPEAYFLSSAERDEKSAAAGAWCVVEAL
jgi:hypothetical protein